MQSADIGKSAQQPTDSAQGIRFKVLESGFQSHRIYDFRKDIRSELNSENPVAAGTVSRCEFFRKGEPNRETTHAGFDCNYTFPDKRGTSEYGRWLSHAPRGQLPNQRLPAVAVDYQELKLKRSNFRAILLCNAFTELAQGAIPFSVDLAACASRCAGSYSL